MRQAYRALAFIALSTLTVNIAQATDVNWCGYQSNANITPPTQMTTIAQILSNAQYACITANAPPNNPGPTMTSNKKSLVVQQLGSMITTCNTAATASSSTDPSINQCIAAYACLKVQTQTPAGEQLNVCLIPNSTNNTCAVNPLNSSCAPTAPVVAPVTPPAATPAVTLSNQAQGCATQYGAGDPAKALAFLRKDVARLKYNYSLAPNTRIAKALNAERSCCNALNSALNNDTSCPPPK
jgi:hypothetical protein